VMLRKCLVGKAGGSWQIDIHFYEPWTTDLVATSLGLVECYPYFRRPEGRLSLVMRLRLEKDWSCADNVFVVGSVSK